MDIAKIVSDFEARYGAPPSRLFRAPGRVNLIGEHTDYNDGFVLPCAIDFASHVACFPREDRRIRVASTNIEKQFEFSLDDPPDPSIPAWTKYVQGVSLILERGGSKLNGADLLIDSNVPIGSGLSSSAALEISIGYALSAMSGLSVDGMKLARIGQAAEHEFAGVRSGIMDQFASVFGKRGHALFLDCRSMEWSAIPLPEVKLVVCNTKTKHDLAEGEYNKRRAQCEEAARLLGRTSLRDVEPNELTERPSQLSELLWKRARHVVNENQRVVDAVAGLESGSLGDFGQLMNESHNSLRDDYEVSSRELDIMVEIARTMPGVLGSRMTGGGFGGCTINLVVLGAEISFGESIFTTYREATGITPEIYYCEAGDGVREIDIS